MRTLHLVTIALILAGCSAASAKKESEIPTNYNKENYSAQKLLASKQSPDTDFTTFRMSFTKTDAYKPYQEIKKSEFESILGSGNNEECIERAESELDNNHVSIFAHILAGSCHQASDNFEKAAYHKFFMDGLFKSINASGDGKTLETAIRLISPSEQYAYLWLNYLQAGDQELVKKNGKVYDKIQAEHKSGRKHTIFFDVTAQLRHLNERLNNKIEK